MSDPEAKAVAAYWRFFEGTNSGDSGKFTRTLNFPHVRVSARGWSGIVADAETHARNNSFESLLAMGWDHTVGMAPEVLHITERKVHILGGWTRYTKEDEPIIANLVTYIATEVDGHWGMQSRYGIDRELPGPIPDPPAVAPGDTVFEHNARTAEKVVSTALASAGADNSACSACFHYPFLVIHPGQVESFADAAELGQRLPEMPLQPGRVRSLQAGPTGATVAFDVGYRERLVNGICLVRVEQGAWRIKSGSFVVRE